MPMTAAVFYLLPRCKRKNLLLIPYHATHQSEASLYQPVFVIVHIAGSSFALVDTSVFWAAAIFGASASLFWFKHSLCSCVLILLPKFLYSITLMSICKAALFAELCSRGSFFALFLVLFLLDSCCCIRFTCFIALICKFSVFLCSYFTALSSLIVPLFKASLQILCIL